MEIKRDRTSEYYTSDNRKLGNCFTVFDKDNTCHYEFEVRGTDALVKCDSILYIKDAITEFRKFNKNVISFHNESRSFYQGFDEIQTFKLPLDILQPSKFFIDKDKYDCIEEYLSNSSMTVPVCIIDEEYILLDGHARVRFLYEEGIKMVSVYMDEPTPEVLDDVYIAKENNIFKVKNMEILSHEDYMEYLNQTGRKN